MGWHINYEVEFQDSIDWDDDEVKRSLKGFNVQFLYLRDMDKPRVMLCVYSQNPVEDILGVLIILYSTGMRYRIYNTQDEWLTFDKI
jgi:hypothetical protein